MRVPLPWTPFKLETSDRELIEYFCSVASASLATFGYDATALGTILVRIALHGQTPDAAAVLHALLAFSSLHRYGLQAQAAKLKISALKALTQASAASSLGLKETIEHTATGMLLCSFEVHISSCSSDEWMAYLAGVETVIIASDIDALIQFDPEVAVLMDWVHYYHALARFSLLYWERDGTPELPSTPPGYFSLQEMSCLPPPINSMLSLLSQVCDTVSSSVIPSQTSNSLDDYKGFVQVLDWRIRSLSISLTSDDDDYTHIFDEQTLTMYLYQLSLLLLLNRSSNGLIDKPIKTQQLIDKAFSIFARLSSCKQQFPIHVIGCEARTDEQRALILDIISRTENMSSSRSFNYTKKILQAVWAQDDLRDGSSLGYRDKLTWVISHCMIVPAFV